VLIVRVHPEILRAQKVPRQRLDGDEAWEQRYRSIADLEAHLERNGTRVVKFFLHVSKDEQRKRFLSRIDEAERNWKFSRQDVEERKYWKDYMRAYAACLEATSTRRSPWYVVPADDKPNARLIVSRIIVETLKRLDMAYPQPDAKRRRELLALRKLLAK
jgi:polyphosphate kinase 2 (PPK2 family)